MSLIYVIVAMMALLGLVSLGVDYGRVQSAKTQLQAAADAAARYGSVGAAAGNGVAYAIDAANDNTVDGTPLVLTNSDVTPINWNTTTNTYTATAPYNGVLVNAHRMAARGTGIPLLFAKVIGISTCDIHATSLAYCSSGMPTYGWVGINSVMLQNNTILVDSYASASGSYGGSNILTHGYVATNGGITMTGGVTIHQDVYMQSGQSITANGSPSYGTRQTLSSPLSYSNVTTYPVGSTLLGNVNGGMTLGSGSTNTNYYSTGVSLNSGQTLNINGPVTLYVNGNLTLNGTVNTYQNLPANFTIRMMSGAGVNIQGNTLYADIYAPQSPANINSGTTIYGRLVSSQLSVSGSANLHYDESLPALPGTPQGPTGGSGSGGTVVLEE